MYKYVFLDLDDTIWDFKSNAQNALNDSFQNLKLNRYFDDFEQFLSLYLTNNKALWEKYGKGEITKAHLMLDRFRTPLLKVGVDDLELAKETGKSFMEFLTTKKAFMPYANELLVYLSEKYPLTIISNGFFEVQHRKIKNSGIDRFFTHVVLSDDLGIPKPNREIFERALQLNNASPENSIMIGDNFQADIVGAQNAGIDQVFYNVQNYQMQENDKSTFLIHSLKELFDIL